MQKKEGVSLIVLVITIIVMVILAGAIILSLNNAGIINKANDAVEKTNLKQVQQLASLAWAEAYADGVTTVEDVEGVKGFKTRIEESLKTQAINLDDYVLTVTDTGVEVTLKVENKEDGDYEEDREDVTPPVLDPALNPTGVIPEGGTYITGYVYIPGGESAPNVDYSSTVTLTAGQNFPQTPSPLDRYIYGDYVYIYDAVWYMEPGIDDNLDGQQFIVSEDPDCGTGVAYDGWLVTVASNFTKTSYGEILESISGKPIMSMNSAFRNCVNLTEIPEIPSTVNNMQTTFDGCTSLTGSITINVTPTEYYGCLSGTQVTEILGTCGVKSEILATK